MQTRRASLIKNVTALSDEEIKKREDKQFEYWGLTPREARKVAVGKKKGLHDKRSTMKDAVAKYVGDGMNVGVAGFVNTRVPIAVVHEMIRQGAKDLTLSYQSASMTNELLAGAMIIDPSHVSIKRVTQAWWGYEVIGIAPLFRYLIGNEMMEIDDYTNYGASARFKAAAMGLPFIPIRDHGGSDMELVNNGKMIECPFTGRNVYVLPACYPDVAIVHVQMADMYGNCRIFGAHNTCPEIAMAAGHTIVVAEEIVTTESIRQYPNLTEIPYVAVDAVVEQPFGGYPGAVYGYYWFDMPEFLGFRSLCDEFRKTGNKDKLKEWYDKYIFGCETFDDYLATRPYSKLKELRQMDGQQPIIK
jgi:glutaconate CoA-transferase subunit A